MTSDDTDHPVNLPPQFYQLPMASKKNWVSVKVSKSQPNMCFVVFFLLPGETLRKANETGRRISTNPQPWPWRYA